MVLALAAQPLGQTLTSERAEPHLSHLVQDNAALIGCVVPHARTHVRAHTHTLTHWGVAQASCDRHSRQMVTHSKEADSR
jgi:hypothetical protein